MPKLKLSKTVVDKLPALPAEVIYWDNSLSGFGVRVKSNDTKSYVVQYRIKSSGRSRRKTIGQHGPLMSYLQARDIATGLLADVLRGGDPVAVANSARQAPTMHELAVQYMAVHAEPKKRPKSVANDRSMLDRIILPKFGSLKVVDIGHKDVQTFHNSLKRTPYQANRVLSLMSKMFELSIKWGWATSNPVKGVEKFHEEKRHRWLSQAELLKLTNALDAHPNQNAANVIRFQLLTGARIGEILSARWPEFELDRGVWIKPSHHTKQKRTEHLPLANAAVELLNTIRIECADPSGFVFPGRSKDRQIVDLKKFWRAVTDAAGIDNYRIHDNRHTYASHLVSSGASLAIVGRLLGHTNPMTTQRYAHLADDPLRDATNLFGQNFE